MTGRVPGAVAAAVAVARTHRLAAGDPAVLHDGVNACLATTSWLDGRAALAALPVPVDEEALAPFVQLRRLHAAVWWFVHAVRVPADLAVAGERLAAAVEEVSAGPAGRRPGRA